MNDETESRYSGKAVLVADAEYKRMHNATMLFHIVVNMIKAEDEPEHIVSYIKKQYAAWVAGKL